jgi:ABC-type glutathione transport system ATPase component
MSGSPGTTAFTELVADGVSRYYGTHRHRHAAVDDVSLTVNRTSRIGIVGESGSGKSTLARLLVGLERPSAGTVSVDGQDLRSMLSLKFTRADFRRAVQFVAQDTTSSFDPLRTLRDAIRTPAQRLTGLDRAAADARVDEMARLLGLSPELADRHPAEVSGGQRQRFAIARALVVNPAVLICDEVVSALDVSVQGSILNLLKRYCAEHDAALVFVSHGLPATAFVADELVVMRSGAIVEHGPTARILAGGEHPYTRQLLAAFRGPATAPAGPAAPTGAASAAGAPAIPRPSGPGQADGATSDATAVTA